MDRRRISAIAHGEHPIAAPLGDDAVRMLLDRAVRRGDERVLDLGCGEAAWLVRALTAHPAVRAEGVDIDDETVARGRTVIADAGLADRITLVAQDAKEFTSPHRFDVVVSIGASHAFGGLLPTLDAARRHLADDGCVLVGEGFWEREPSPATLEAGFAADEYDDLATTVAHVVADGWAPVYGHVSTAQEWDHYEWSWTGTLSGWALDQPTHPDSPAALAAATEHRQRWLRACRGTLGFVTLLLRALPQERGASVDDASFGSGSKASDDRSAPPRRR
jgi:SAM-dependent methyltransferase